ncbi:MAG: ABC transporter permease subunit [Xanthomonadales bacterium]|nr:ABC transporter permease subunit [Xanthomonadales bacterium]
MSSPSPATPRSLQQRLRRDRNLLRITSSAAVLTALSLLLVLGFLVTTAAPLLDPRPSRPQPLAEWTDPAQGFPPARLQFDADGVWQADDSVSTGGSQLLPFGSDGNRRCFEPGARRWCLQALRRGDGEGPNNALRLQIEGEPPEQAELIVGDIADWIAGTDGRSALTSMVDGRVLWITAARDRAGVLQLLAQPALQQELPSPVVSWQRPDQGSEELLALHADGRLGLLRPGTGSWRELWPADAALVANQARLYAGDGRLARWQDGHVRLHDLGDATRAGLRDLWQAQSRPGQPQPSQLWQAHANAPEASTHLNLWPLLLGSLKAACLGLLIAAPLAMGAAMHAVQYRSGRLKHRLKAGLELCEAIPTVVLGMLALLWLAPWLEQHLGLALAALLGWLIAFLWPARRHSSELSDGQRARGILRRALLGLGLGSLLGAWLEQQLPGGQLTLAMGQWWGLQYQTYNSIVVALVVGLAISPTLYSLTDEALQAAPPDWQEAALALGASRRDTLFGLLLPAAAPGLLAALLVSFGRALGETLIVLMVSGNTPLTTLDPLQGLRSISATLVLEAPQAVPGTLHYQALLLAALLLTLGSVAMNLLAQRWLRPRDSA